MCGYLNQSITTCSLIHRFDFLLAIRFTSSNTDVTAVVKSVIIRNSFTVADPRAGSQLGPAPNGRRARV